MTMQVGMVGSDGIILASDTKIYAPAPRLDLTITTGISKIRVDVDAEIAILCAGNMKASLCVADAIIASRLEGNGSVESKICQIAASELEKYNPTGCEFLVYLSGALYVYSSAQDTVFCQRVATYAFCGHSTNAAIFWANRFFTPSPPRMRTCEELIPLAAQIIVDGGVLNSGAIGGLEIVRCTTAGIQILSTSENNALEVSAYERSLRVGQVIFPE